MPLGSASLFEGLLRTPAFLQHVFGFSRHRVAEYRGLAALIAIPYSYTAPSSYIDTNVKGTLNVVQAAIHGPP